MQPSSESPTTSTVAAQTQAGSERQRDTDDASNGRQGWNFLVLTVYQIVVRAGWIFKTESIVMPAVLDTIAGAGWIRGWLPLLNRLGNSIPPLLAARFVEGTPQKKWILSAVTAMMGLFFLALAGVFRLSGQVSAGWTSFAFLVIYALFFMSVGLMQLSFATLQGKLIQVDRRGRLMLVSNVLGSVIAIAAVIMLLPSWLATTPPRFDWVFGLAGMLFLASAVSAWLLAEPRDPHAAAPWLWQQPFVDAWLILRRDRHFRHLAIVAALFGCSIMLFPHYQNMGLRALHLDVQYLLWWLVIQNVGTGLFSIPAGAAADRWGNRLVLQITLLGLAAAPISAIALLRAGNEWTWLFHGIFVLIGLTPVVYRTVQNFALEFCREADHPRYLSTLGLCMALPLFLSPLFGWLVDRMGFEPVFLIVAGGILVGWFLTFSLHEPRDRGVVRRTDSAAELPGSWAP